MSLRNNSSLKLRKRKSKIKAESWEEYDKLENELYREFNQNREPTVLGLIKISSGKLKNLCLEIPKQTRPLTSRLKTSIFDILGPDIIDKTVLDLFAGTGSFGFEALSRGAKYVEFVDASKNAEKTLITNCKRTGMLIETNVIRQKSEEYLIDALEQDKSFEIIFIDPPYKLYNSKDTSRIRYILTNTISLLPGIQFPRKKLFKGAIIVKHPARYDLTKIDLPRMKSIGKWEFGLNCITIYIVDTVKTPSSKKKITKLT